MLRTADKRLFVGKDLPCVIPKHHPISHEVTVAGGAGVFAAGSTNTKGSYSELTAASTMSADGFFLTLMRGSAIGDWLVDVALGAAASEVDLVSNVLVSSGTSGYPLCDEVYIPIPIPSGSRISARCQSSDASAAITVGVTLARGGMYRTLRKRRATTYGAATGDSGGTQLDPGGVANTYPASYTEITASLTNPIESMLICIGSMNNPTRSDASHRLKIAKGAAASEVDVISDLIFRQSVGWDTLTPGLTTRHAFIPAGERLAAIQMSSITDATDRLSDLVVIGFD